MTSEHCAVVTTTIDTEHAAGHMASAIIESRLAACVQYTPIHSTYRWKGSVESSSEYLLLVKTRNSIAQELIAFIKRHHPYELPEIIIMPITGGLDDYLEWIATETT